MVGQDVQFTEPVGGVGCQEAISTQKLFEIHQGMQVGLVLAVVEGLYQLDLSKERESNW
jgi:hypothetical protein